MKKNKVLNSALFSSVSASCDVAKVLKVTHVQSYDTSINYYYFFNFFLAKCTKEDVERLRLFQIESAANYRARMEEEKNTSTDERIRQTNER